MTGMKPGMALAALLACALLAGCADRDVREVRDWMDQVQRDTRPRVKPLPEPKEFIAYAYGAGDATDPFSQNRMVSGLPPAASDTANAPDTTRPREQLEGFPLDTMRMVGTLQKGGIGYALLQIDRNVYQVRAGQRIGQNFGVVARVGEDAVQVREVVQDAAGDWVERMSRLELQNKETGK